jgi:hypothetical protein
MIKPVSDKLGIKKGMRAILINPPANFTQTINLPELNFQTRLVGEFDYIHLFTITENEFHKRFPNLKNHLKSTGMLWVSWPKSGQEQTDLKLTNVIRLGYDYGLVESKSISLDKLWSALKFTHPKKGKIYNNSYGKLKE